MSRGNGQDVIEDLLTRRHLEQVPANPDEAQYLLVRSRVHLATTAAMVDADPEIAYDALYAAARKAGYSLQASARTLEGRQHPDRDAQFGYLADQAGAHLADGQPYDIGANTGWVSVGSDHDTAAFAVATLRNWWDHEGHGAYPDADRPGSGSRNPGIGRGSHAGPPTPSLSCGQSAKDPTNRSPSRSTGRPVEQRCAPPSQPPRTEQSPWPTHST